MASKKINEESTYDTTSNFPPLGVATEHSRTKHSDAVLTNLHMLTGLYTFLM